MENQITTQTENITGSVFPFRMALVTDVIYKNGDKAQMINLYSPNMDFENIVAGIQRGLLIDNKVASSHTKIATLREGQIHKIHDEYAPVFYTDEQRKEIYKDMLRIAV